MYVHKNGLTLVKIEKEDLPLLKDLKNESWFGTHNITFVNNTDQEKWFNTLDSNKNMVLVAKTTDTNYKVGIFKIDNIDWVNRKCYEGHDIFKEHRGNGYGKLILEAGIDFVFEVLNMNRVEAEVLENNIASQKCCEYIDYSIEGVKRSAIHKCGDYINSIIYGMLREEWFTSDRVKYKYEGVCNLSYKPKNNY
jgi:RimJ/RimL family protein N-acetyltransferase